MEAAKEYYQLLADHLRLEWTNFLLACVHCNSCKGATPIDLAEYYWPDRDDTLRAFQYEDSGRVIAHPDLTRDEQAIARRTLELMGLDKIPGGEREPSDSDRRWLRRREAYRMAVETLNLYHNLDRSEHAAQLVAFVQSITSLRGLHQPSESHDLTAPLGRADA